ncbi:hypothetical protein WICPIJ_000034 [Wickerhamomyces pijperi]|uniref:t-SNARE coiled-coil homology domain-containing protein n=1 Tax=Wickerhamomyces pijperi TaxID=599730 RepID=A0A9P8QHW3_WICPI|nr:hypothetical protein WICPIJ_000034 [Wickerhamomyces pijperi]
MGNLTAAFTKLVQQIEQERGIVKTERDTTAPLIPDTFISEATDLYDHIIELGNFLHEVRPRYLINDTGKYLAEDLDSSDVSLSEAERDQIDSDSRIQLRQYNERLKLLEVYESKRIDSKSFFRFNQSQSSALNSHRKGILLSLSFHLKSVSKFLINMQEIRLSRRRDIDTSNDLSIQLRSVNVHDTKYSIINEPHHKPYSHSQETTQNQIQHLTQEQIQILETENSHLLNSKLEDLVKVEKIHKSVMEISQMETELAGHLQLQSESINNLVNDFDMTELDLKEGNKILKKNKKSGNTAARSVMFVAFVLGLILLLLDHRYN